MLEYRGFCYLDVPKTGSTFLIDFLRRHARGRPVREVKHSPPRWAHRWRKLYFITTRDPFDLYASLYAFGCAGKGGFRKWLRQASHPVLAAYDGTPEGFEAWLDAMTGPDRRELMPPQIRRLWTPHLGLMGLRHARLALPRRAWPKLAAAAGRAEVEQLYRRTALPRAALRLEHLHADTEALIDGPLGRHLSDPPAARAELAEAAPINATPRPEWLRP